MLTLMLAPMTPHLAEELWEMLGHKKGLSVEAWPQFSEDLARENEVEVVVQINGRVRGKVTVSGGASQDEVVDLANVEAAMAAHLAAKRIQKDDLRSGQAGEPGARVSERTCLYLGAASVARERLPESLGKAQ